MSELHQPLDAPDRRDVAIGEASTDEDRTTQLFDNQEGDAVHSIAEAHPEQHLMRDVERVAVRVSQVWDVCVVRNELLPAMRQRALADDVVSRACVDDDRLWIHDLLLGADRAGYHVVGRLHDHAMVRECLLIVVRVVRDGKHRVAGRMTDEQAGAKTDLGLRRASHPSTKGLARGTLRSAGPTLGTAAVPLPFMSLVGDRRGVQKHSFLYYFITPRPLTL